jgi:hypothetical protein
MGAAGITIIVLALFFGYEALTHFRRVGAASAASSTSSSGVPSTGGSGTAGGSLPATAPSPGGTPQPTPSSQPPGAPNSSRLATSANIQDIITRSQALGIDPNAVLAIAGWESNNFDTTASGDNGNSYSLFQIYKVAHPDYTCGFDATCNIQYWFSNFGAKAQSLWQYYGGIDAFNADPTGFLQKWAPAVQSSDPWSQTISITAQQRAQAIRARYNV